MSNMKVLERKEFRKRERTNREQIHKDTVVHEDLRPHTKALDGYIFTIFLDSYNKTQVRYIY